MKATNTRKVLVTGATGAQGRSMLRAVLARGFDGYGLVRDAADAALIESTGARARIGNLDDGPSLDSAFEGIDAVALVLPFEYDVPRAVAQGRHVVDAAVQRNVARVVFNTSTRYPAEPTTVPAFEVKREVVRALAASGLSYTVVRPTFYLENLLGPWTLPGIVKDGVLAYPIPTAVRAPWVAHDDVAKVIAALVERDDLERAVVEVSSAEATTGAELARFVGTSVGRPVSYVPIAPGDFQVALSAAVGAKAAEGVAALYRWIEANPETRVFDHDASVFERLGLTPTPVREWAQRQAWKVAP
jgi:uncharacterized protein YbjT (DUF2867 family)